NFQPVRLPARDIGRDEDGVHAGGAQRAGDVDGGNARVRVRAAQCVPPQHVLGPQIAAIEELPFHLGDTIHPPHALSDAAPPAFHDLRAHDVASNPRMRFSTPLASAAITSSSMCTSRPSRTTTRPSTVRWRTRCGKQYTSAATGSTRVPARATPSVANSATSPR